MAKIVTPDDLLNRLVLHRAVLSQLPRPVATPESEAILLVGLALTQRMDRIVVELQRLADAAQGDQTDDR